MSSTEGRQSPPPESQTGAQLQDAPGQGQGTDNAQHKDETNKSQLDVGNHGERISRNTHANKILQGLSSNPAGPLDEAVKEKFTKTQ